MIQFDLNAEVRNKFGKGANRTLRRAGQVPAVLYGPKVEAQALTLDRKILTKALVTLQKRNAVFNLDISEGDKTSKCHVVVKEIQAEPITGALVHADFLEVKLDQPMVFVVPIQFTGSAKGVDLGGEMHISTHTVTLRGLILDIPDVITIDVSNLSIGDKLLCSDLDIPAGVELLNDVDSPCASVITAHIVAAADDGVEAEEAA